VKELADVFRDEVVYWSGRARYRVDASDQLSESLGRIAEGIDKLPGYCCPKCRREERE
jgi:hypothetical protein